MKWIRIFKWAGAVLAAVVVIVVLIAYLMLRASLPERTGSIGLEGIRDSVSITYDRMGIPHIWARYEADAWFALGWLHASERLFQMELNRRAAAGRLSEMLGEETMDFDRTQRIYGHQKLAESYVRELDMASKIRLQAYCNGVNAWAEWTTALPFEYYLLDIDFTPWTPTDCLSLYSFQTWFSDALQDNGPFYQDLADKLGMAAARQLKPDYPGWVPDTVPPKKDQKKVDEARESIAGQVLFNGVSGMALSSASNSWVVAPQRSATGSALLASDPHLDVFRLPQFWYIAGIHAQENALNIFGTTSPGIPFIPFGHNGKAAWAFTAGGVRIMDIYEEKLDPENTNRYKTPDGWETFSTREEVIYCDGEDKPDTLQILISRHGPVTDMHDSLNTAYALRWAGFDVNLATAIKNAFELPHIADFQNFRQIITGFGALNANWMYADVMGNIGYQLGTPVPVRNWTYDGFRLPGWVSDFEWQGYHPLEDTPHSFNPEQGWLGSCNNRPDSANLNYELPGNYAIDRILRLQELMNSQEKFSVADLVRFQQDRQSAFLMLWRQDLVDALHSAGRNDLADRMTEWDGSMEADSREAALMELWLFHMKQMIFKDEMGELVPQLNRREIFRDRVLYNTYHEPYPIWFDNIETDDVFETRDQIAQLALEKALEETDGGEWGAFQMLNPAHPFSVVPVIGWLLDLEKGPFPRAGSNSTLNASFSIPEKDHFKVLAAPSWRFVIDFNDIDAAKMMAPAGQSGHPLDAHFFDFYDMWESGQMWNVPFSREKVYARSYSVLNLLPLKAE